jgi:hypothetical protein
MRKRLGMALIMILGSFSIYCVQSATNPTQVSSGGDGGGGDASAQSGGGGTCCTPTPRTFVPLAEGDVSSCTSGFVSTNPIAVGNYSEVVLYVSDHGTFASEFRATATSQFGVTGTLLYNGGRIQVNGSDMRFRVYCTEIGGTMHWTIAGVQ